MRFQSGELGGEFGALFEGFAHGLVGAPRIGRNVAELLQPFQLDVLFYDPYMSKSDAAALGAERVLLEALMSRSDVVSFHVPVTPETTTYCWIHGD